MNTRFTLALRPGPAASFLLLVAALAAGPPAAAQPPSPIDARLFAFPGSMEDPASAAAAGLAMSDQWLGDEPFYNPAAPGGRRVILSPTLLRVSRQDLRAANRNYDDQAVFFDLSGFAVALPGLPVWIYGSQPTLRFEDYSFTRGTGTDPSVPPAFIAGQSDTREGRAGLSASFGAGRVRAGAAFEWTRRDDRYFAREESGAPERGDAEITFEGDGYGGNFGLRYDSADSGAGRLTVGGAVRYLGALDLDGHQVLDLASGLSEGDFTAEREAGWEMGLSARYFFTPEFAVLAAGGGRTEQEWKGLGVTSGAATMWRLGLYYHDAAESWTFRLGYGQDQQNDAPEPRAGVLGVGFGWDFDGVLLNLGAVRRSIERGSAPTSYEDRVIGSVVVGF